MNRTRKLPANYEPPRWKDSYDYYVPKEAFGAVLAYLLSKFNLKLQQKSTGGYGKPQYTEYRVVEK